MAEDAYISWKNVFSPRLARVFDAQLQDSSHDHAIMARVVWVNTLLR